MKQCLWPHRDFTDYEDIFPNARRDSDDNVGALLFTAQQDMFTMTSLLFYVIR